MELEAKPKIDLGMLSDALERGMMQRAAGLIEDLNPAEIALLIESLPPARRDIVWNLVSEDDDAEVLAELNDEVRTRLMKGMDTEKLLNATEGMELDDLADVVADLPESITRQVIHSLNQRDRERLEAVQLQLGDAHKGYWGAAANPRGLPYSSSSDLMLTGQSHFASFAA